MKIRADEFGAVCESCKRGICDVFVLGISDSCQICLCLSCLLLLRDLCHEATCEKDVTGKCDCWGER